MCTSIWVENLTVNIFSKKGCKLRMNGHDSQYFQYFSWHSLAVGSKPSGKKVSLYAATGELISLQTSIVLHALDGSYVMMLRNLISMQSFKMISALAAHLSAFGYLLNLTKIIELYFFVCLLKTKAFHCSNHLKSLEGISIRRDIWIKIYEQGCCSEDLRTVMYNPLYNSRWWYDL